MRRDCKRCNQRIRSMITDGYERCRQRKLPSMPSDERKLYYIDDSDNDLRQDTTYGNDGRWSMGLDVEIRRWDHFGMFSCLSLLFFSSLDLGPVQMASAWVVTTFGVSQVAVDFPRAPDPPKGRPEWYRSVAGLMGSCDCIRGTVV
jgi:hypothetical protein